MGHLELLACLQILLHQLLASMDGSFLSSCHVIPALPHSCCTCCKVSRHSFPLPAVMLRAIPQLGLKPACTTRLGCCIKRSMQKFEPLTQTMHKTYTQVS